MKIIEPSFKIMDNINGKNILKGIEKGGRICYKSEDKITDESADKFVKMIIKNGHESVLEHEKITIKFICDRGVTHEIVRHRIASYSQESTRYCNYSKNKYGNELTFIKPFFWKEDTKQFKVWKDTMATIEREYIKLVKEFGSKPEEARSILPNSLKTEIVVTMNLREWRYFLKLRTSERAHPQMREITIPLLKQFKELIPIIFDDIIVNNCIS